MKAWSDCTDHAAVPILWDLNRSVTSDMPEPAAQPYLHQIFAYSTTFSTAQIMYRRMIT
jgi:hypothetical protein